MSAEAGSEIDRENRKVVSLIMEGDRKAVDLLFASHLPQLRRTASWMLANSDDSEDAVQDGLLLAYRKLNQFQGRAKFSTWLQRIVINAALARIRRQRSKLTISIDQEISSGDTACVAELLADPRPNPEEEYIAEERSRILARTLEDLSTTSQAVIHILDIEGIPGKQAAKSLGISLSALKSRHLRARRSILRKIQEPPEILNTQ